MKVKNKSIIFFLMVLMVLAIFSVPSIPTGKKQENSELGNNLVSSAFSWNTSDYINFTGPLIDPTGGRRLKLFRIFIDETNSSYTWNKTAAENKWCSGSGTYSDPYVIENLFIYGNGTGGMIYIKHSTKYFVIRNCWFNYSGTDEYDNGVCLHWTGNGTIENNIFTYLHRAVNIELLSFNNIISNNIMISDHITVGPHCRAIDVGSTASNVTIINNKIRDYPKAMYVAGSSQSTLIDSTIEGNYCENTVWPEGYTGYPIYLSKISYCQIVKNIFAGSFATGTFEIIEDNCVGNIIINNTVMVNKTVDFGPETPGTLSINTYKLQTAQTSPDSPMKLENCHYNYIAYNVMIIPPDTDQAIPGYEVFFILGLISIVSIVILKRINKK